MSYQIIKGDILKNIPSDKNIIIPQICNDEGGYGRGFSGAISKQFPIVEKAYREWFKTKKGQYFGEEFKLGKCDFIPLYQNNISMYVVNMICQHNYDTGIGRPPIRYAALGRCMHKVAGFCKSLNLEIMAPKFGSGNSRGCWQTISEMIEEEWVDNGICVTIFEL